jgi:4'-phosphopantetheinyl transferase
MRFPKRRREWLLGRWTAKRLLLRAYPKYAGLPLNAITVGNDPDGAPYLSVADVGRLALSLSISHRSERAFCALLSPTLAAPEAAVGADMELVEPRDPAFVSDYFTAAEAERVWAAPEALRNTLVTVLWSAKEAVLKVLRLGLTVDTRSVELRHVAGIEPPFGTRLPSEWAAIEVHCALPDTPPLCAWWKPQANYVLTLAAFSDPADPPCPR